MGVKRYLVLTEGRQMPTHPGFIGILCAGSKVDIMCRWAGKGHKRLPLSPRASLTKHKFEDKMIISKQ